MFGRVARRYDLLNHLLSASLDRVWRRRLARSLALPPGSRVLDLCCGTGDQAVALRRPGYRVVAGRLLPADAGARRAPKFARRDRRAAGPGRRSRPTPSRLALPGRAASTAPRSLSGCATSPTSTGPSAELARVLRPGGELGVLEFTVPAWQPLRGLYLFYFRHLLPGVGRPRLGRPRRLRLPAGARCSPFPQREEFIARLEAAGFDGRRLDQPLGRHPRPLPRPNGDRA